jgi:hypothetical protein
MGLLLPAALSPRVKRPNNEADTHLYFVLSLRMHGTIPPLALYVFMACIVTILPLPLQIRETC